jgi:hypothetical protein
MDTVRLTENTTEIERADSRRRNLVNCKNAGVANVGGFRMFWRRPAVVGRCQGCCGCASGRCYPEGARARAKSNNQRRSHA